MEGPPLPYMHNFFFLNRLRTFFGHVWSYEQIAKRIKLFRGREVTNLAPFNIDSPLYISKKKFVLFIRFMVLKTTGLNSRFQRKNRF